jgi:hypothetical protein
MFHPLDKISRYRIVLTAKGVDLIMIWLRWFPMSFELYESAVKMKNPDAFLEVYNPDEYRNYIRLGKMDYLYDKVETYDKLKDIIQGKFCLMDCRSFKKG